MTGSPKANLRAWEEGRNPGGSCRAGAQVTADLDQEVMAGTRTELTSLNKQQGTVTPCLCVNFPNTHQGHSRMCPSSENLLDAPQVHTTSGCCQGSWALRDAHSILRPQHRHRTAQKKQKASVHWLVHPPYIQNFLSNASRVSGTWLSIADTETRHLIALAESGL